MGQPLFDLLPDLYALRTFEEYPAHALAVARALVGADKADYTEVDFRCGDFRVLVDPEPPALRDLTDARRLYMHEHPVLRRFTKTPTEDAFLISDFLTRAEFRRLGLYGEFFSRVGVEDQLSILVTDPRSPVRAAVSLDRDRRSFGEQHRRLLEALRPHLVRARLNAIAYSAALRTARPAATVLDVLTDRQRQVLAALAEGKTNAQIALELGSRPGTVRKHVENILRRLGTPTRTAAAALYLRSAPGVDGAAWSSIEPAMLDPA